MELDFGGVFVDKKPNQFIQKSTYWLVHAYNPIDWYAWEPEVFGIMPVTGAVSPRGTK
jgi:hypothetical protein